MILKNLKKEVQRNKIDINLDSLIRFDFTFFEKYEDFIIISVDDYTESSNNIQLKNYYCSNSKRIKSKSFIYKLTLN